MNDVHFAVTLHPQHTTWSAMREHGLLVDELGYDSLWTWDHFVTLSGDPNGPNFEGWQILPAWGALTTRVRIGMLVTGNTYRHPTVLAKMAATLDHITNGRAILGLGAAWNEREHSMYGIPFDTAGVRLAKLAESARVIRSLLDQPRTSFAGRHYRLTEAVAEPKPLQAHLPLMIGGGGERKTLRVTAAFADMWHGFGGPSQIAHKLEVLRRHCEDVGRDPAAIAPTATIAQGRLAGDAASIARRAVEFWKVGVRGFFYQQGAPFDRKGLEFFAREVRPRVLEAVG
jgi:F420-dependent oxidoreductase-like protein